MHLTRLKYLQLSVVLEQLTCLLALYLKQQERKEHSVSQMQYHPEKKVRTIMKMQK
jgi:hypothetical protein